MLWPVLPLHPFLEGTWSAIRTDHNSLWWIFNLSIATKRLAKWQLLLSELDFEIVHRAGVSHQAADGLSQLPTDGTKNSPLEDRLLLMLIYSDEKIDETTTTISTLETHTSAHPHFINDADRTNTAQPAFADFTSTQPADEFCQQAARKLGETVK